MKDKSLIFLSMASGLVTWFLILSGIQYLFNIEWLETGKYYILCVLFVLSAAINLALLNKIGGK